MKNKKWLTYTFGILLALVVLAAVGMTGYRIGMTQTASAPRIVERSGPAFGPNFDRNPHFMQGNNHFDKDWNFASRRGGFRMFPPLFGLIHIAVLGLVIWLGYKLVQKSGWRFVRVEENAPVVEATPNTEGKKKKNKSS